MEDNLKKIISMSFLALPGMTFSQNIDRPNILWITYEDTSPHFIGCYGNEGAKTKTMDALANDDGGIRFEWAYSNSTVSSASRSCIITGVDVNVLGTNNHRYERKVPANIKAFPYYLRQAGYYTSNNVKTDYNISNPNFINEAWNESSSKAHWRNRSENQPFFSVFNIMYSHQSYVSRNDYASYLSDIFPLIDADRITQPQEALVPDFYKLGDETSMLMARMQNCINYTDQLIEERLKELKADGLDDNTIIFIFSDHGEGIPRGKTTAIGMGYRVPFIVWFPDKWKHLNPFKTSVITDRHICFEDLAPTILHLVGVEIPDYMKGTPIFSNAESPKYIHGSRNRIDDSSGIDRSVIKGKYIYTRVFCPYLPMVRTTGYAYNSDIMVAIRRELNDGGFTDVQAAPYLPSQIEYLYDIEADKWEMDNLADNPEYALLLEELRNEMVRYAKETRDLGFMPEFEMQRRCKGISPMEIREDFDIDAVVDAAMLVGEDDVLEIQINLLDSDDPIVRYWAAVGIYVQGNDAVKFKDVIVEKYQNENFEGAKLKLASFLYKYCNYEEAKETILAYCRGTDNLLANDAVQMIQNMGDEKILNFEEVINEIQPYWNTNDANYCVSPSVNVTQLIIRDIMNTPFSSQIKCDQKLQIKNVVTAGFLSVNEDGTTCQTYNENGKELWTLDDNGDGLFYVRHNATGKYLCMKSSGSNGVSPTLVDFEESDQLLWNLRKYRNGYFLESLISELPLQVNSQSKKEGAIVSQWEWNGKTHFVWQLVWDNQSAVDVSQENDFELLSVSVNKGQLDVIINTISSENIFINIYDLNGQKKFGCAVDGITKGVNKISLNCNLSENSKVFLLETKQKVSSKTYRSVMKYLPY